MIYLIFTVAITHLSGFKLRQRQQQREAQRENMNRATAVTLQTQLHLLRGIDRHRGDVGIGEAVLEDTG